MPIIARVIVLIIYIILFVLSFVFANRYRVKKIKKTVENNAYKVLNHDYMIRIPLSILNVLLLFVTIHFIFSESEVSFNIIVSTLSILIAIFVFVICEIYTLSFMLVYSNDKIYIFYKNEVATFERDRVHFQEKNGHTLMYYKDDLVFDTKKKVNLKIMSNNE